MRAVRAGLRRLRERPIALAPQAAVGAVAGLLIVLGGFPAGAEATAASAPFPLGVYFDVKQALTTGSGWAWVAAAAAVSVALRGAAFAGTLWLAEGAPGPFVAAWGRGCAWTAAATLLYLPTAALFFAGVAVRYAPFVWIGALVGFITSALLIRIAMRLDVGRGTTAGKGVPEITGFLAYTYIIVGAGALTALAPDGARWIAALVVLLLGPLHAVFLVGWRAHAASGTYAGGGTIVTLATVGVLLVVFAPALFDRLAYNSPPIGEVANDGSLLLLGGVDSTTTSGALAEFDPRDVGVARDRAETLSYRRGGERYTAADTRRDLDAAAARMSDQIRAAPAPRRLLGHSQASLIIDRLVADELAIPNASVVFAPSVPYPPEIDVPAPDARRPGKPGGDATRALSAMLDAVGLQPFHVDAPASPTNLDPLVVRRAGFPRLAVWALADSVWLDGDWRRPGQTNIVVFTDHVGATNNARALDAARRWFAGGSVPDDESNWRGGAVSVLRYVMAPWRPR